MTYQNDPPASVFAECPTKGHVVKEPKVPSKPVELLLKLATVQNSKITNQDSKKPVDLIKTQYCSSHK